MLPFCSSWLQLQPTVLYATFLQFLAAYSAVHCMQRLGGMVRCIIDQQRLAGVGDSTSPGPSVSLGERELRLASRRHQPAHMAGRGRFQLPSPTAHWYAMHRW
jgi:hypothetical protein